MKILYDTQTDSIYVKLLDDEVVESQEQSDGSVVDFNANDEIVAAEVFNVKSNPHEVNIPTVLKSA